MFHITFLWSFSNFWVTKLKWSCIFLSSTLSMFTLVFVPLKKNTINLLFNWFIYFPVFCKYFCTSAQGFNQHSWERQAGIVWIFRQNGEFFNTLIWKVCILEFTLHCRTLVKLWKNEIKYFTLWIWMKLRSFKMSTLNLVWVAKQHKNIWYSLL